MLSPTSSTIKIIAIVLLLQLMASACRKENTGQEPVLLNGVMAPDHFQTAILKGDSILLYLPWGTNLKQVRLNFILSSGQTLDGVNNSNFDLSLPRTFTISEGESKKKFYARAVVPSSQPITVQGIYVSNVGSNALATAADIEQTVNQIADAGLNCCFVVVYNKSKTLHPSNVLKNALQAGTTDEVMIYPGFDALRLFIEKAHARDLKVIAWFEYGFASHYSGFPSPLLDRHPEWASRDINGATSMKNNFFWLNGYNAEVQKFMTDLFTEVVRNYAVDGVQGDDRLPAMPINSGYDEPTLTRYQTETGKPRPTSDTDSDWMQWRATQLTNYGQSLAAAVKAVKPGCLITFAPSTSGWSYSNYLQQWDQWLYKGFPDLISPQLYRNESQGIKAYTDLVNKDMNELLTKNPLYMKKYAPAILLKSGSYQPGENYLAECIKYNRSRGISGEVFFYFDGLKANERVFKAFYPAKAIFPSPN